MQTKKCPYHLLIALLKHEGLHIRNKYTYSEHALHMFSHLCPHMKTFSHIITDKTVPQCTLTHRGLHGNPCPCLGHPTVSYAGRAPQSCPGAGKSCLFPSSPFSMHLQSILAFELFVPFCISCHETLSVNTILNHCIIYHHMGGS